MKPLTLILMALTLAASPAVAGLKVLGEGDSRAFDASAFPADKQASYKLMESKCAVADCHGMGRSVDAIATGTAQISQTPFDKEAAKKYGVKMMRMPNSGIDKAQAKELVELMYF
ncbi:MAG: hypothetical protein P1P84_16630, partial [Deferrisomatales bacterium]|nr:hypothetical protein [Deferrisomatales bacterium]